MIIESTKIYLFSLTKTLLTSDISLSIMYLIEMLPLFYHILLSSFSFSSNLPPLYFTKDPSYLSYYSKLHTDYPSYIVFPLSLFMLFFLLCRHNNKIHKQETTRELELKMNLISISNKLNVRALNTKDSYILTTIKFIILLFTLKTSNRRYLYAMNIM